MAEAATIRADIVHGLATGHIIDGTPTFRLVRQASALTEEIRALRRTVSPASSPLPPSPDAAGGP